MLPSGMVIEMGSRGFFAISSSYFFLSRSKLRGGNSQHHKRAIHRHAHGNRAGPYMSRRCCKKSGGGLISTGPWDVAAPPFFLSFLPPRATFLTPSATESTACLAGSMVSSNWAVLQWCFAVLGGRQRGGGLVKRSGLEGWSTGVPRQNTRAAKIRPGISCERLTHEQRLTTKAIIAATVRSFRGRRRLLILTTRCFSTCFPSTWPRGVDWTPSIYIPSKP